MVRFPSDEWIKAFKDELNKNKTYEEVAKIWEGDFLFVVTPDDRTKKRSCILCGSLAWKM